MSTNHDSTTIQEDGKSMTELPIIERPSWSKFIWIAIVLTVLVAAVYFVAIPLVEKSFEEKTREARDWGRIAILNNYAAALSTYKIEQGSYPVSFKDVSKYLLRVSKDPLFQKENAPEMCKNWIVYEAYMKNDAAQGYRLISCLESKKQKERRKLSLKDPEIFEISDGVQTGEVKRTYVDKEMQ